MKACFYYCNLIMAAAILSFGIANSNSSEIKAFQIVAKQTEITKVSSSGTVLSNTIETASNTQELSTQPRILETVSLLALGTGMLILGSVLRGKHKSRIKRTRLIGKRQECIYTDLNLSSLGQHQCPNGSAT